MTAGYSVINIFEIANGNKEKLHFDGKNFSPPEVGLQRIPLQFCMMMMQEAYEPSFKKAVEQ